VPHSPFDLPDRLAAKRRPELIAEDERRFAAIRSALDRSLAELEARLDRVRRGDDRHGQGALERDLEVHRLGGRIRALRRYGLDLCLGRMVREGQPHPTYIGRLALADEAGEPLLVDWRAPAAAPFFAATRAQPLGVRSRRRYRWTDGRITDYWDEAFVDGDPGATLDAESAFIASLGASRSPRMRDVLGTIQADQDAIIRADAHGALVVDGGPGTGKTVVALHRTAYLLYADPRVSRSRGGALLIGPHRPYLAYIEDVLPGLGEEGVRTATIEDLVAEGAGAVPERDPAVAALKADGELERAIEALVRERERPPAEPLDLETPWGVLRIRAADWTEAFDAVPAGLPHDEGREEIREALSEILGERIREVDEDATPDAVRRLLDRDEDLAEALDRSWPVLDPVALVAGLWSSPALLRRAAPWLDEAEVERLQRAEPRAWTDADLPLLDAARQRIGDPDALRRRSDRAAALVAEREARAAVAEDLIAADDSDLRLMTMLRGADAWNSLLEPDEAEPADRLQGPFAHLVVDEAQELTDAQWRMLRRRCPSGSLTIVGDRAQARRGFAERWEERLGRLGFREVRVAGLTVNYRTPAEVMAVAEPAIRAALPDANVPAAIRSSGVPVRRGARSELDGILADWLAANADGVAAVIGEPAFVPPPRVLSLAPELAKGLEFDLVVLVDPGAWGEGIPGAVDRYVAMTRSTRELVVLQR